MLGGEEGRAPRDADWITTLATLRENATNVKDSRYSRNRHVGQNGVFYTVRDARMTIRMSAGPSAASAKRCEPESSSPWVRQVLWWISFRSVAFVRGK